jgi:hypothetical protein
MEAAWATLSERERRVFNKRYRSAWISNLVGIPLENALPIRELFQRGQLEVMPGLEKIEESTSPSLPHRIWFQNGTFREVDQLMDATSSGCSNRSSTPLIDQMERNHVCAFTDEGAFRVNFSNMEVQSLVPEHTGKILAVGEMALGPNFVSNSIESNYMMAKKAVDHVFATFRLENADSSSCQQHSVHFAGLGK